MQIFPTVKSFPRNAKGFVRSAVTWKVDEMEFKYVWSKAYLARKPLEENFSEYLIRRLLYNTRGTFVLEY